MNEPQSQGGAKAPKSNLSQINFQAQHWWKDRAFIQRLTEDQVSIEEQKAAMWFEAARRRPEVQQAWLEGNNLFGYNGWQHFTTFVVLNFALPWTELEPIAKRSLIETSYCPWAIPPAGYSTFPTDKEEQRKVSMMELSLPESNDPVAAQGFVERARKFADAGFLIVAVDKKQKLAVRSACAAIEKLPPTFRAADMKEVMFHYLPPDISEADRQQLADKQQKGILTAKYVEEIWDKYIEPTTNLLSPWHTTAKVENRVFHKRERQGRLIEEKQFNFDAICRQLESFDNGCVSDFVNAVRL